MTQTPAADIVERLRTTRASWPLSEEAAIEIEALRSKLDEAVKALEATRKEAETANTVISLNRDGSGQGRIKVATAMHRIAQWSGSALAAIRGGTD